MNGATEATLAELLMTAESMNANLEELRNLFRNFSASGGTGGGSGASSPVTNLVNSFNPLSSVIRGVTGLFSGLMNVIKGIIGIGVSFVNNLVEFSFAAANGTATLKDFYGVFSKTFANIPVLGFFLDKMVQIVAYTETLLATYQNITNAGASFSGNLFEMRNAAVRSNLSLSEFASIVSLNSDLFATMGLNVQNGISKFVEAQRALIGPDSDVSRDILALGVTAQESAGYLVSVMRAQGVMNKTNTMTASELAKATKEYIYDLDMLSKLTGQRRDQIDAEVKQAEADQAWNLFLNTLSPERGEKARLMLAQAAAAGGPAAVEQLKASLRGVDAPLGKLSEGLAVASGGMSIVNGQRNREILNNDRISLEQTKLLGIKGYANVAQQVKQFADGMGTAVQAVVGSEMLPAQMLKFGISINSLVKNGSTFDQAVAQAMKDQLKQRQGDAANVAQAQLNIRNFGNAILDLVFKIIAPISNKLVEWGESFTKTLLDYIPTIANFFETNILPFLLKIGNWFTRVFSELGKVKNADEFWAVLKKSLLEGGENVWNFIKPLVVTMVDKITEVLSPYLKEAFNMLIDAFNEFTYNATKGKFGIPTIGEDPLIRRSKRAAEAIGELTNDIDTYNEKLKESNVGEDQRKELESKIAESERRRNEIIDRALSTPAQYTDTFINSIKAASRGIGTPPVPTQARALTTLGATGKFWETGPKTVTIGENGPESVINPDQLSSIVSAASNNSVAQAINQLNNTQMQLLRLMAQVEDNTRRTFNATNNLSRDGFAIA